MKDFEDHCWQEVSLGEICEKTETVDPRKAPEDEFDYVDVSSVSNETFTIGETQRLLGADAPSRARRQIRSGDILFATIRPTLQRVAQVPELLDGQVCSTGYIVLRPKPALDARFLMHSLFRPNFMGAMESLQSGASYPAVTDKQVRAQTIPLPPLEEQQRIVAILDEAFEGLARARAHAETNLHNARELVATSTDSLCSEATEDWTMGKMGDFCTFEGGFAFKSGDTVKQSQVQLVRIGNLYQNILDLKRKPVFYPNDFAETYRKFRLKAGDIILSLTGTVGKQDYGFAVAVPETDRALLLNQRVARIMPKNTKILSSNFLLRFLRSASFLATLYNISRGTRQANLSTRDMADLPMSVPTISKQLEIVESLGSIEAGSIQLIAAYERSIVDLDELRQSLLQKAFAGVLT